MSLTQYKEGSFRELWTVSLPIMLSLLSGMVMLFIDRLFLAQISPEAHNASVEASTLGWAFCLSWTALTCIAEVFVAQYNGAGLKDKLGAPVWQMIWLSVGSILFFVPLSYWLGPAVWGSENALQNKYLFWMLLFGSEYAFYGALSSFFIAQGRVKLITVISLSAASVNIALDYILIFGVPGWVPMMGIEGASIATAISQLLQTLTLGALFLSKKNRDQYGTGNWKIIPSLFKKCVSVGTPAACFIFMEIIAWAFFYRMLAQAGYIYITIGGICQDLLVLFYFFCDGLCKGATTVVGNLIGAKKEHLISQVMYSGLKLSLGFLAFLLLFIFYFKTTIGHHFLPHEAHIDSEWMPTLTICLYITIAYLFFDCVRFLFSGILTAAGDTRFLMISGVISIWIFLILPIRYFIVSKGASIITAWWIALFYAFMVAVINFSRIWQGKWQEIKLTQETSKQL